MEGKLFNSRNLIGQLVTVYTKKDEAIVGTMLEYFERNNAIVLKNYVTYKYIVQDPEEMEEVNPEEITNDVVIRMKKVDEGDIMIIKGDGWIKVTCKKFEPDKLKL